LESALAVNPQKVRRMSDKFKDAAIDQALAAALSSGVELTYGNQVYHAPASFEEACRLKEKYKSKLKIYSGATDLGVQDNKRVVQPQRVMSLHLIEQAGQIKESGDRVEVGAKVSLRILEEYCRVALPELANFLKIFASPQ